MISIHKAIIIQEFIDADEAKHKVAKNCDFEIMNNSKNVMPVGAEDYIIIISLGGEVVGKVYIQERK
jgi:hypothetical protein